MKKKTKKRPSRNIGRNHNSFTNRKKKNAKKPIDKKWFWIGGAAVAVFVIVLTVSLVMYYREPVVARVNGTNIMANAVQDEMWRAENVLRWDYFDMFPNDWNIDYDRIFRNGLTFGRTVREEAVRFAALAKLYEEYADLHGISADPDGYNPGWQVPHISDTVIWSIVSNPILFAEFERYMDSEDEFPDEVLAAKHILAHFDNFDSTEEAEDFANNILARLLDGEDFDTLMHEYTQDTGIFNNPNGYTFVSGVMVSEFEQATRELAIGEMSGLVRTIHGFHIVLRIEPNMNDIWGFTPRSLEQRMMDAIERGFLAKLDGLDITFLSALDNIPVG